jgi:hypothetical protein
MLAKLLCSWWLQMHMHHLNKLFFGPCSCSFSISIRIEQSRPMIAGQVNSWGELSFAGAASSRQHIHRPRSSIVQYVKRRQVVVHAELRRWRNSCRHLRSSARFRSVPTQNCPLSSLNTGKGRDRRVPIASVRRLIWSVCRRRWEHRCHSRKSPVHASSCVTRAP